MEFGVASGFLFRGRVPVTEHEVTEKIDDGKGGQAQERREQHGGENEVGEELALGGEDDDAQALGVEGSCAELADDRADDRESRGDAKARENTGEGGGELEFPQSRDRAG